MFLHLCVCVCCSCFLNRFCCCCCCLLKLNRRLHINAKYQQKCVIDKAINQLDWVDLHKTAEAMQISSFLVVVGIVGTLYFASMATLLLSRWWQAHGCTLETFAKRTATGTNNINTNYSSSASTTALSFLHVCASAFRNYGVYIANKIVTRRLCEWKGRWVLAPHVTRSGWAFWYYIERSRQHHCGLNSNTRFLLLFNLPGTLKSRQSDAKTMKSTLFAIVAKMAAALRSSLRRLLWCAVNNECTIRSPFARFNGMGQNGAQQVAILSVFLSNTFTHSRK